MPDAPHDLRDYLFDELTPDGRAEIDAYLKSSPEGRAELEELKLTYAALLRLPEEEIPQRIAFVSDPVLEPSLWQRFWSELIGGAPRFAMGMAAVMLVFFGGVWATEPTLSNTESGWSLAFGGAVPLDSQGYSEDEVLAIVREAVEASETKQLEAIAAATGADDSADREWVAAQIVDVRRELTEVSEDAQMGYELVNTNYETLRREVFQMDLASLGGFEQ